MPETTSLNPASPEHPTPERPTPERPTPEPLGVEAAPIGVVVVNYASSALLAANLGGVPLVDAHVVVVDNLSTVVEREAIRGLTTVEGWTLVEMAGNPGFGAGVNAGVARAEELGCGAFLFLNPDAKITADTVSALRRACIDDPGGLVAPLLVGSDGHVDSAGTTINLIDGRMRGLRAALTSPDPRARPVTWVTAACLAVSRDLWHAAGGFAEDFFMYWEDVDFNFRGLRAGGHVVLREDLTAIHDQGGTQGERRGRAKSALYYYYNARNRLLFGLHHLERRELLRWWVLTPQVSWEVLLRGGRRQLLDQPRLAWSAASGGLAGMWLAARGSLPVNPSRLLRRH